MMNILIAANLEDIPKIKNSFKNFTRIKGTFPLIKNCHDFVNSKKYRCDYDTESGWEDKNYPLNVLVPLKEFLKEYDIVIVPIDNELIKVIRKYKKIKRFFIYEEEPETVVDEMARESWMESLWS